MHLIVRVLIDAGRVLSFKKVDSKARFTKCVLVSSAFKTSIKSPLKATIKYAIVCICNIE